MCNRRDRFEIGGDRFTIRVIVDRSVVEVYADHRAVISLRVFPPAAAESVRLTAQSGTVKLLSARAWKMDGVW